MRELPLTWTPLRLIETPLFWYGVTPAVLTEIYGEEDWSTTIRKVEDDDETDGAEAAEDHNDTEPGTAAG